MSPQDLARILAASYKPNRSVGRLLPTDHADANTFRAGNRKSAFLLMTELRKRGHRCDEASVRAGLDALKADGLVSHAPGGWAVVDWDKLRAAGAQ